MTGKTEKTERKATLTVADLRELKLWGKQRGVLARNMLADLGYPSASGGTLMLLLGDYEEREKPKMMTEAMTRAKVKSTEMVRSFYAEGTYRFMLIIDCWNNSNGYIGERKPEVHRQHAMECGAVYFEPVTNLGQKWGLPNWGVDYIVIPLDRLPSERRRKLEADYACACATA